MANSKPNILWICTDEQRFDTLGCYGNPYVMTPNIDQLAQKGTLVEHAFVQCPVCTPSRSSFLTGRYPRTTKNRQNGHKIDLGEVLIPKILRENGYYTGLIGKLHLSPCDPEVSPFGEPRIDDGYVEFHWSNSPNPKCMNNEYSRWLWGKGKTFHTEPFGNSKYVLKGMPSEYHHTKWAADTAIDFIEAAARQNKPWLLSLNPMDPHFPLDPPFEVLERYLNFINPLGG
jgi:arylsulfatase